MMTYDDFMEKARAELDRTGGPSHRAKIDEPVFYASWTSRGEGGGSCWGDAPSPIHPENEPELTGLMELLDDLDLKLRHANAILKETVRGSYTESGYYGNWSEESFKYVTLAVVCEKLVEFGYVEANPEADATP